MSIFKNYSLYYNLLYRNKDYEGEALYIQSLLKKYGSQVKTILDLGCGTGRHDFILSRMGYHITGIDLSESMLEEAKSRGSGINFCRGDIRSVRLEEKFDAILSLFHVISYQTENDDLVNTFTTVKEHLKDRGIFIFDCWYGPAVLTSRPEVRIKRLEDNDIRILRISEPLLYPDKNIVDVNYEVIIEDKKYKTVQTVKETHSMRYLFDPEIKFLLHKSGLKLIHSEEWMSGEKLGFQTWYGCYISVKDNLL